MRRAIASTTFGVGGLLQNGKLGLDVAHGVTLSGVDHAVGQTMPVTDA